MRQSSPVLYDPRWSAAEVLIPIRTVSEMNAHEHWRVRHARKVEQQRIVGATIRSYLGVRPPLGERYRIVLTRIAERRMDVDNLASSFKHTIDSVAAWLGIDDGSDRLEWCFVQERAKRGTYAVRVRIEVAR